MGLSKKLNFTGCKLIGSIPLDVVSFGAGFFAGLYKNTGRGLIASFLPLVFPILKAPLAVEVRYKELITEKESLKSYGKLNQGLSDRIDKEIENLFAKESGGIYHQAVVRGFNESKISALETAAGYGLGYTISTLVGQ